MSYLFQSSPQRLAEQARLEQQNLQNAITMDQFIAIVGDRNINDLRTQYSKPDEQMQIGPLTIDRARYTEESWRYVKDPRDPSKYIDMDHFLANADLNSSKASDIGIAVEIQQLQRGFPSAFTESDLRSNGLGSVFGTRYYKAENKGEPLKDYLRRFRDDYKGNGSSPPLSIFPEPNPRFYFFLPLPDYVTQTRTSFNNPPVSPLVLDLDGDGVELTTLVEQVVHFDMDMDGFEEATGWVKADDGLLVLDRNGDGLINDLSELFGTQIATDSGFTRLQPLDTNADGWISAADAAFAALRVWRDLDQDAMSNSNELFTLTQLGIAQIRVTYSRVANPVAGQNTIVDVSTYERTDGTQRQIVDVWFALDQLNSRYDFRSTVNAELTITREIFNLPKLRGYGNLPDLTIAIARDGQLPSYIAMRQEYSHHIKMFYCYEAN
jgi:hypothetical protein